jgi:hypothetical protein
MEWIGVFFYVFKVSIFLAGMGFAIKWHYDRDRTKATTGEVSQSSSELRLFMAMIVICGVSFLGIVYAACSEDYAEGGRGGAIGCALFFVVSLLSVLSKPSVEMVLDSHHGQDSQEQRNSELQTERLRAAFVARLASAQREKVYLGVAGFISALAWKFGSISAAWLDFRH